MNACTTSRAVKSSPRPSRRLTSVQLSILTVVLLTSCMDFLTMPRPDRMVTLWIASGDHQAAEVGTELPVPIVVRVADASGVPIKGVEVQFQGDGKAVRTQARTDDEGYAWTSWELGTKAGAQMMRATAIAPNVAVVLFASEGVTGPPSIISVEAGTNQVVSPGTELDTVVVAVRDRYSNPVRSTTVSWSVQQGSGSVKPLSELTDYYTGRARAIWTLGQPIGVQRLVVSAGAISRQITATAGPVFLAAHVVAGSDHTCALTADGTPHCWGTNWTGQLGRGYSDYEANPYPVPIPGYRFKTLAAGGSHTCGLADDGATFCWGNNMAGQVGVAQSLTYDVVTPTRVAGAPAFVALTAGWFHTCGLTAGGHAYCWGDNSKGQLGRGTDHSSPAPAYRFSHPRPERVSGSLVFTSISSSPSATSTCGVAEGVAYCWGESVEGVLGREVAQKCRVTSPNEYPGEGEVEYETRCSSVPVYVATHGAATSVIVERYSACAILATTELECWGHGSSPMLVPAARVSNAWALWSIICGETGTEQVTCWYIRPPFIVANPFGAVGALVNLHSSGRHSCGIAKATSVLYCWGSNFEGALGDGTTRHRDVPGPVVSPLAGRSP